MARFVALGSARRTSQFALCADPVRARLSSAGLTCKPPGPGRHGSGGRRPGSPELQQKRFAGSSSAVLPLGFTPGLSPHPQRPRRRPASVSWYHDDANGPWLLLATPAGPGRQRRFRLTDHRQCRSLCEVPDSSAPVPIPVRSPRLPTISSDPSAPTRSAPGSPAPAGRFTPLSAVSGPSALVHRPFRLRPLGFGGQASPVPRPCYDHSLCFQPLSGPTPASS